MAGGEEKGDIRKEGTKRGEEGESLEEEADGREWLEFGSSAAASLCLRFLNIIAQIPQSLRSLPSTTRRTPAH